jgi:hypothetical protein
MKYLVLLKKINFNPNSKYVFVEDWDLENVVERHPNFINVGYEKYGIIHDMPEIDKCLYMSYPNKFGMFRTSPVTEILSATMFKTLNSIYSITILNEYDDDESIEDYHRFIHAQD